MLTNKELEIAAACAEAYPKYRGYWFIYTLEETRGCLDNAAVLLERDPSLVEKG